MRGPVQLLLCSVVVILTAGCSGVPPSGDPEDVGTTRQQVINGNAANGWPIGQGRLVSITQSGFLCSGTLVRPRRVVTAKHCIHPQLKTDATTGFTPFGSITVTPEGGGAAVGLTGYTWWNTELALLYLDADIAMDTEANGRYGQFTSVWHGSDADLFSRTSSCYGYGNNAATQAQCNAGIQGTGAGTLRGHTNTAISVSSTRIGYSNNGSNQNFTSGDSGGSCYLGHVGPTAGRPNFIGPLGWYGDLTCVSLGGQWNAARLDTPHPADYRVSYRSVLASASTATNLTFSWNSLSLFGQENEPGVNPSWSWNGSQLVQSNNAYQWNGAILDGAKLILDQSPMGDGFVGAIISSGDDDVGGVVGRWHNEDSFYRVGFDEERRIGRLLKRTGNTWVVLDTYTVPSSFDWSTPHTVGIGMRGQQLWGYLDGTWVMSAFDSDGDIIDGYSGIVSAALSPTNVDQFWTVNWP